MKVTKLEIKEFFNIRNANLDLSNGRALIVGPNGCGKTNIIKCILDIFDDIKNEQNAKDFFLREHILPVALCNRRDEDGDSFVKLDFNVQASEREMFVKLRMNSIIHKVVRLCESLDERHTKEWDVSFLKEIVLKLRQLTNTTCDSLHQWQKSRSCADVTITKIYLKDTSFGSRYTCTTELKVEMPDKRNEETQIISDFLKTNFGENVLEKSLELRTKYRKEEKLQVIEIIHDIVQHEEFFRSECTRRDSNVSDIYSMTSFPHYSGSYTFDQKYQGRSLSEIVCSFLNHGTICILPQSRGFSRDEKSDIFWNLDKAEKKIVEAYLWEEGSDEHSRLNKVKEAMLFIAGLELDVSKYPSSKYEESLRNAESLGNAEATTPKEACVSLRECNKSQAEWRKLYEVSGGQRELLMVLSVIHLSNADNVFLDEPGHSLHPSKQTQLRRWFETRREPSQVLFAITHSTDMISPQWLGVLYHMFPDGDRYSAACLKKLPQNVDDIGASASNQPSSEGLQEMELRNDATVPVDRTLGSKASCSSTVVDDGMNGPPPSKKPRISIELAAHANMIDFLMSNELRRLFFSCGVVFVEGVTDKRVIQALRDVELRKVDKTLEDPQCTIEAWSNAHKETQMDRWDIIPIHGSANWLKAYRAAEDLKIPFIVVLDADVLNQKSGSVIHPITYKDFMASRLKVLIDKLGYDANHPFKEMVENVVKLVNDTGVQDKEIQVREEMKRCHLWVWSAGFEDLFFKDERVKGRLAVNEQFIDKMEELQIQLPETGSTLEFWEMVEKKLHGGNWKRISFELLKKMVEIAIDQQDHPLHKLWEYIKITMINRDTKARIPSFLIEQKFNSMRP